MSKIAFCFPGQGSLEEGMGREIAEAFPAARDVYRIGSEATGLDLEKLCFSTPLEQLVDTELQQPALVATSLAILDELVVMPLRDEANLLAIFLRRNVQADRAGEAADLRLLELADRQQHAIEMAAFDAEQHV